MGRHTKLTPERQEAILDGIRAGLTIDRACQRAGISHATYYNWKTKGLTQSSGIYVDFVDVLTRAEIEVEQRMLTQIQLQSAHDWRAAVAFLEKRFPERYGKQIQQQVQLSGPAGAPATMQIVIVDPESHGDGG